MDLEKQYEQETGKKAVEGVVGHGERAFATWEYLLWLEKKARNNQAPMDVDKLKRLRDEVRNENWSVVEVIVDEMYHNSEIDRLYPELQKDEVAMPELTPSQLSHFDRERDVIAYVAETLELMGGDGGSGIDTLQKWLYRLRRKALKCVKKIK